MTDDESIFTRRPKPPKWLLDEANRQWDAVPDSVDEIKAWQRGEPVEVIKQ